MPLSLADHATKIFKKMFPPGLAHTVASKYGAGHTKTRALVEELAFDSARDIITILQTAPYCLATDGSNDADSKLYPIIVRYMDPSLGFICENLLCMPACTEPSTGENIFKLMDIALAERNMTKSTEVVPLLCLRP